MSVCAFSCFWAFGMTVHSSFFLNHILPFKKKKKRKPKTEQRKQTIKKHNPVTYISFREP